MSKYINDKIVDKSKEIPQKNKFFKLKKNNIHLIPDELIDEAEQIVKHDKVKISKRKLKREEDFIKACDLWMVEEVREFKNEIKEYLLKAGVPQQFALTEEEAEQLSLAGNQQFQKGQLIGISNYHEYGHIGKVGKQIIQNHLRVYEKELIKALQKQENIKKETKTKKNLIRFKRWVQDNADNLIITGLAVPTVLALGHIFGCAVVANDINKEFMGITQENIERINQVVNFTGKAFNATESNNNYFLEIYGFLQEKPDDKAIFSSVVYGIDKETYEFLNKHFDVNFKLDQNSQVIDAENFMQNVSIVGGFVKSNDIRREAYAKISDITANQQAVEINKFTEEQTTNEVNYNVTVSYKNEEAEIDYNKTIGDAAKLNVNIDFVNN